jgi:hypothetical protein
MAHINVFAQKDTKVKTAQSTLTIVHRIHVKMAAHVLMQWVITLACALKDLKASIVKKTSTSVCHNRVSMARLVINMSTHTHALVHWVFRALIVKRMTRIVRPHHV